MKIIIGGILILIGIVFIYLGKIGAKTQKDVIKHVDENKGNFKDCNMEYDKSLVPLFLQISINKESINLGFGILFIV